MTPPSAIWLTNASIRPVAFWIGAIVGNAGELVEPVRKATPSGSTAMACATPSPFPPKYVEYPSGVPAALSLLTNAARPPAAALWSADTVGKSTELVAPVTYTLESAGGPPMPLAHSGPP